MVDMQAQHLKTRFESHTLQADNFQLSASDTCCSEDHLSTPTLDYHLRGWKRRQERWCHYKTAAWVVTGWSWRAGPNQKALQIKHENIKINKLMHNTEKRISHTYSHHRKQQHNTRWAQHPAAALCTADTLSPGVGEACLGEAAPSPVTPPPWMCKDTHNGHNSGHVHATVLYCIILRQLSKRYTGLQVRRKHLDIRQLSTQTWFLVIDTFVTLEVFWHFLWKQEVYNTNPHILKLSVAKDI